MRMVHFPAFTRWWPDAQDQILKFPHGAKDDFVDAHVSDRTWAGENERSGTYQGSRARDQGWHVPRTVSRHTKREGYDRRARSLQGW